MGKYKANNSPISARNSTRIVLAGASSLLALAASNPAFAQAAPASAEPQDEIIVTGIIASLQRNLEVKRDAPGVIDVISAEDIGKFPDSNVAASLQRLPGISVQRSGNRGEPTGITVRGFSGDFNQTLVDGRRVSGVGAGRSLDFSTIGSDFISAMGVYKTPDVTLSSSSIGATLNVQYAKPFDHTGFRATATGSGSINDNAGRFVPAGGVLISNTFADDTFGVLASAMYTRHDTRANRVYVGGGGWIAQTIAPCQLAGSSDPNCAATGALATSNKTIQMWYPQQIGAYQDNTKDERIDARIALQWQARDNLLLTIDDNFSRQKVTTDNYGFGVWFNQGNLRNVKLDENGTAVAWNQPGVSQTDLDASNGSNINQTNMFGANVKWEATDNLKIEADGSWSRSWLNPNGSGGTANGDVGYGYNLMDNGFGVAINGDSSDHIPVISGFGVNGDPSMWAPTNYMGSHVAGLSRTYTTDDIKQARLTAEWKQEGFGIKVGGSYIEERYRTTPWGFGTTNFSQAYAGYGPFGQAAQQGKTAAGVAMDPSLFTGTVKMGNGFLPGYSGSLPPDVLIYNGWDYLHALEALGNPHDPSSPGFGHSGAPLFNGKFYYSYNPAQVFHVTEKTWSLFLRANYETDIAGMPFHFNAGIRNEHTNLVADGYSAPPVSVTMNTGDPTLLTVKLADPVPIAVKNDYGYLLPSIDMMLELTSRLHLRFDASRTLTRPPLQYLNPAIGITVGPRTGALTATGNNPLLKPYMADNFDLALEWYYKPKSYFSVNFFVKNVANFVVSGTTTQGFNAPDGTPITAPANVNDTNPANWLPGTWTVNARVNGPEATVRGVEVALQHVFGNSGFGFTANATFVNTNKPYDPASRTNSGFAVTGLANSANLVAFFDKFGFEARVAVNYRDKYLLTFDGSNSAMFGAEPTFVNASTQVDFSTSYDINKHLTVFGEALNLNNATYSTSGRYGNQFLVAQGYGRRFTVGARFHY